MTAHRQNLRRRSASDNAFTLVELLTVIAIIAVLLAMLLPAMKSARASAQSLVCQSNLHQLSAAFITYTSDFRGRLPLNSESNPADWLSRGSWDSQVWGNAPHTGSIYPYVNSPKLYRCLALPAGSPPLNGIGSNGRFDYVFFSAFNAARLSSLNTAGRAYYAPSTTGEYASVVTPILTEEDPENSAGGINLTNVEGTHSNVDPMGAWHTRGGNFVSVDGSSHYLQSPLPSTPILANQWWSLAPSGSWRQIGPDASKTKSTPGYWDAR